MFSIARMPVIHCNDERKAFRKRIIDQRKQSLGKLGKKVNKFVKTEIQQTRSIFDEHVKFLRPNQKTKEKNNIVDVEVLDAEFFEN